MLAHSRFADGSVLSVDARAEESERDVRLMLRITVDGLRGDLLLRYWNRFGQGGFWYLLENGVFFANAPSTHANTETIVGHATLATGAHESGHGMVGNVVFARKVGELAYNPENPGSPLLPTRGAATNGAQAEPAQQRSRSQGNSPRRLLGASLAYEWSVFFAG